MGPSLSAIEAELQDLTTYAKDGADKLCNYGSEQGLASFYLNHIALRIDNLLNYIQKESKNDRAALEKFLENQLPLDLG